MIQKIDRLLNKANVKGLKVIITLSIIVCFLSANILLIRGLYDGMRTTYLGINIIIEINLWYLMAFNACYQLKRHHNFSSQAIIDHSLILMCLINISLPILFEPSSILLQFSNYSFIYNPMKDFIIILCGGLCCLDILFRKSIKNTKHN
jgi:hypothetical protein